MPSTKKKGTTRANPHRKPQTLMTPQMRRTITTEAHALGLTPKEYLRLAIVLSSQIRENFSSDEKLDAKQLLTLIDNPLFGILLKTVTQTLLSNVAKNAEEESKTETQPVPSTTQPQVPAQSAQRPRPEEQMWEFW